MYFPGHSGGIEKWPFCLTDHRPDISGDDMLPLSTAKVVTNPTGMMPLDPRESRPVDLRNMESFIFIICILNHQIPFLLFKIDYV